MLGAPDPLYVQARHALLDALEALDTQRAAVILVGAQAVYLHVGEDELAVAPYTTDADLALDRFALADEPTLASALGRAGFALSEDSGKIGIWEGPDGTELDLLVPERTAAGPGKRSAKLGPPHGDRSARRARGLEGALIDNAIHHISALDPGDERVIEVQVAGPAALVVAKAHKIEDRIRQPARLSDKDAHDLFRLLRNTNPEALAATTRRLSETDLARAVTAQALDILRDRFSSHDGLGIAMLRRSVGELVDPDEVSAAMVALIAEFLVLVG